MITECPATRSPLALLCSLLLHSAVLLPLVTQAPLSVPSAPPSAVMLEYAADFQTALLNETLPPGINQQRRTEAATGQLTSQEKDPAPPEAEQGETEKPQPHQTVRQPHHEKKVARRPRPAETGNSVITSRAAPPVQHQSGRDAAPLDSDASQNAGSVLSWEALVKAKINRVKMYPPDAERRGRSGSTLVSFTVDARGTVLDSHVRRSSGTIALDKAALAAVSRARPLPAPPPELLHSGVHRVLMPVYFHLYNN